MRDTSASVPYRQVPPSTYFDLPPVLLALFIFTAPLHMYAADRLGFSLYGPVCLLLVAMAVWKLTVFHGWTRWGHIASKDVVASAIFLILTALLFSRFSSHVGPARILGAITVPYLIGLLYSKYVLPDRFGQILYLGLILKCLALISLWPSYFDILPKRPLFDGRAAYLWFGWGLDALACMLVLKLSGVGKTYRAAIYAVLAVLAFNLVGMNSRTLLFLSGLFALSVFFFDSPRFKASAVGVTVFLLSALSFISWIPGRIDHVNSMLQTFLCTSAGYDCDSLSYLDKSTELRIEPIISGGGIPENLIFGDAVGEHDAQYLGNHFWPLAVFKYGGVFGLACFIGLILYFLSRTLATIFSSRQGDRFLGLFALSLIFQVFYAGNIFNNPVLFLMMGFMLNGTGAARAPSESAP